MTDKWRFKDEDAKRHRRELELILAGAALAQGSANNIVTSTLQRGALEKDVDDFIEGIRRSDAEVVIRFLEARGAVIEKGKHALNAIIDEILKQNAEEAIRRVCRQFQRRGSVEELPAIIKQLKGMVEELEEIGRDF